MICLSFSGTYVSHYKTLIKYYNQANSSICDSVQVKAKNWYQLESGLSSNNWHWKWFASYKLDYSSK